MPNSGSTEAGDQAIVNVNEADWARRRDSRRGAVAAVKATQAYVTVFVTVYRPRPATPDPEDRTLAKRTWEAAMSEWRCALRQRAELCAFGAQ